MNIYGLTEYTLKRHNNYYHLWKLDKRDGEYFWRYHIDVRKNYDDFYVEPPAIIYIVPRLPCNINDIYDGLPFFEGDLTTVFEKNEYLRLPNP